MDIKCVRINLSQWGKPKKLFFSDSIYGCRRTDFNLVIIISLCWLNQLSSRHTWELILEQDLTNLHGLKSLKRYISMLSKAEMKVNCSSAIFIHNSLPHTNVPPICCNRLSSAFSVLQDERIHVRVLIIARTWSKYPYCWPSHSPLAVDVRYSRLRIWIIGYAWTD